MTGQTATNTSPAELNGLTAPQNPSMADSRLSSSTLATQQDVQNVGDPEKVLADEMTSTFTRTVTGWKWVLVLAAIYSTTFLYGLDTTITADIQPAIVSKFGSIEKLSWIGTGFPLGSVVSILPLGRAFGLFDAKWLYIASIFVFELGSLLCGVAPTMDTLIVGRVVAGAGGAGMYLGVLNLITVNTGLRERPLYMAACGITWGLGTILGPVIGGSFATSGATWRWSFYINLVIAAIFAPVYFIWLPSFKPQPNVTVLSKVKQIDWFGVILNAGVWATFTMSLVFGGAQWAWSDHRTIIMFVFFGVILVTFIVTQYFSIFTTSENRIFPGDLLKSRSMILLYFGTACAATSLFVPIYFIPLYFQFAHSDSALKAAVRLLPFILVAVFFVLLNGAVMPKIGYYNVFYVASGVFTLIGGALMYTVDTHTSTSAIYGYSVLIAVGAGLTSQAAYSIGPAKVAPIRAPAVIGFINVAQIGSIVIALVISGTIFQNVAYKNLSAVLSPLGYSSAQIHSASAGTQSEIFSQLTANARNQAIAAIVSSISELYALVIAAGAFSLVSSVFMRREKLFMEMGAAA